MRILRLVFLWAVLPTAAVQAAGFDPADAALAQKEMDDRVTQVYQGNKKSDVLFEKSVIDLIDRGADVTKNHQYQRFQLCWVSVACNYVQRVELAEMIVNYWGIVASGCDKDKLIALLQTDDYALAKADISRARRKAKLKPSDSDYSLHVIHTKRKKLSKSEVFGAVLDLLSATVGVAS